MAMQTRCFMPPLSSCGYSRAARAGRSTRSSAPRNRVGRELAAVVDAMASRIWAATRITGLSEFIAPCGI